MLIDVQITSDAVTSLSWTFTTPTLSAARYRVNLVTFDAAGNKDPTNATIHFVIR